MENRERDVVEGIDALVDGLHQLPPDLDTQVACDKHTNAPGSVRLHYDGERLTVDVIDRCVALPRMFQADPEEEGHRDLYLVNAFAARWGTRLTTDGKIVWAGIPAPAPGPAR